MTCQHCGTKIAFHAGLFQAVQGNKINETQFINDELIPPQAE